MRFHSIGFFAALLFICFGCSTNIRPDKPSLKEKLYALTDTVPGTVGIAIISDTDTVTVNNGVHYPMMSVFKLHQGLAVASTLEKRGNSLDSLITVRNEELDRNTWSPMIEKYVEGDFKISVSELLEYSITKSDNNASNLLFRHIVSPQKTDEFIRSIARDTTFRIQLSESEMKAEPMLSYLNYTSPLAAALLMRQVFEQPWVAAGYQEAINHDLAVVTTGQDRLGSAIKDDDIQLFAHKTGSGYRNKVEELTAHNDVGYFRLKDGRSYCLAVFIRDFNGSENEASAVIADISKCVYSHFTSH